MNERFLELLCKHRARLALLPMLLVLGAAADCDVLQDDGRLDSPCNAARVEVAGAWSLEFSGTRESCRDPGLNGSFRLVGALPLSLAETPVEGPPNEAVISGEVDGTPAGTRVDVEGSMRGRCMELRLTERSAEGTSNRSTLYTFDGVVGEGGYVTGRFTGEGPESCRTRGSFTLDPQDTPTSGSMVP